MKIEIDVPATAVETVENMLNIDFQKYIQGVVTELLAKAVEIKVAKAQGITLSDEELRQIGLQIGREGVEKAKRNSNE